MSRKAKNIITIILLIIFLCVDAGLLLLINSNQANQAPTGEMPNQTTSQNNSDAQQPPAKPDDTNTNTATSDTTNTIAPNNTNTTETKPDDTSDKSTLLIIIYILVGINSAILAITIAYIIVSKFNKLTSIDILSSRGHKITFTCLSIVLAAIFVIANFLFIRLLRSNGQSLDINFANNTAGAEQSSVETAGSTVINGETKTLSGGINSTTADESAILVQNAGNLSLTDATITKTGDSSNTENSEFYGVNAGILVQAGSTATITKSKITTDAKGSNAIFATGTDSKIYVSNSVINTTGKSSARGLDATYGGYIEADNIQINTEGDSCASLATDRGNGTIIAKNSNLKTNGSGSPLIYSTGDISTENSTGNAAASQIAVIEGKNSANITNSNFTASASGNRGDTDQAGIMIYQSMSGDASEGVGTFTTKDSILSILPESKYYASAPMFFITNTDAEINLTSTTLDFGSGVLIDARGTSEWGNKGSNGGNVTLNADNQTLNGNINADEISTLVINLTSSTFIGSINSSNLAKSATLTLSEDSTMTLSANTYLTSFENADTSNLNINFNGYTLYVNNVAIN